MIELKFLKELILVRHANQKSVMFVAVRIFLDKGFKFQPDVCNGYHNVLMMSMNLSGILNIYGANYCWIISKISKIKV